MARLVLEQTFENPIAPEEMNAAARRIDPCLERHGAQWLRTYISADRKRVICEFEAPDAESVRSSYRAAGVRFDACWVADVYSRDDATASY